MKTFSPQHWHKKLKKLVHDRLVEPLHHSHHPPEYSARGVFLGLFVALTPTVGIQMPIIFLIWFMLRKLKPSWEFNLLIALAWTWVTNLATVPPVYYTFLVTGRIMLGHWDALRSYDIFSRHLEATLDPDAGWLTTFWVYLVNLFDRFGLPLFIGCIPWALIGSWLGYRWSLRLIKRLRAMLEEHEKTEAEQSDSKP